MVSATHAIGIAATAESIEPEEQNAPVTMGCVFGQSYLLAQPMPQGILSGDHKQKPLTASDEIIIEDALRENKHPRSKLRGCLFVLNKPDPPLPRRIRRGHQLAESRQSALSLAARGGVCGLASHLDEFDILFEQIIDQRREINPLGIGPEP